MLRGVTLRERWEMVRLWGVRSKLWWYCGGGRMMGLRLKIYLSVRGLKKVLEGWWE
jgi:hypothetical protein